MPEAKVLVQDLAKGPLLRVVNFHLTPTARVEEYDRQFELYARHFAPVTEDDLDQLFVTARWDAPKPGLILAFYNGYRNNFAVARPLLDTYGLTGWFYIVTGFVDAPDQAAFAASHGITAALDEHGDGRIALSWDEIRELSTSHVVASHTRGHERATIQHGHDEAAGGSQRDFLSELGRRVRAISWAGGATYGEHHNADQAVDAAGFQFVVSNFRIQRLRDWP